MEPVPATNCNGQSSTAQTLLKSYFSDISSSETPVDESCVSNTESMDSDLAYSPDTSADVRDIKNYYII